MKTPLKTPALTSGGLARRIKAVEIALTTLKCKVEAMHASERRNVSDIQQATAILAGRLGLLLAAPSLTVRAKPVDPSDALQALENLRIVSRETGTDAVAISQACSRLNTATNYVISQFPSQTELQAKAKGKGTVAPPPWHRSSGDSGHKAIVSPSNRRKPRNRGKPRKRRRR